MYCFFFILNIKCKIKSVPEISQLQQHAFLWIGSGNHMGTVHLRKVLEVAAKSEKHVS